LIQVYQYFLQHRGNDFITLGEEVKFIENYIFLLQIRYKNNISVSYSHLDAAQWQMVLPFSLQLLVENAIKHNYFDQEQPLSIRIAAEKGYLVVSNSRYQQPEQSFSASIGLKNLRSRYRIICNQHIHIVESADQFVVKLPLNQSLKMNDSNHNHRRRSN
ncbi:MAG: histidine kinase, partial [Chitinophagaceae bacterium]